MIGNDNDGEARNEKTTQLNQTGLTDQIGTIDSGWALSRKHAGRSQNRDWETDNGKSFVTCLWKADAET